MLASLLGPAADITVQFADEEELLTVASGAAPGQPAATEVSSAATEQQSCACGAHLRTTAQLRPL